MTYIPLLLSIEKCKESSCL